MSKILAFLKHIWSVDARHTADFVEPPDMHLITTIPVPQDRTETMEKLGRLLEGLHAVGLEVELDVRAEKPRNKP